MEHRFSRTEQLLGKEAMDILAGARVAVFGIGGVGGYAVEALARSGVGAFDLIDHDRVSLTNINRQIIATEKTLGLYKTDVMKERILEINPDAAVCVHQCFFLPETKEQFPFDRYSYVVDAVDTVTAKIALILEAQKAGTPIISSMGAGNKLNPAAFEIADIYETSVCPLAKVMRRELKKRGVKHLKAVYSKEPPLRPTGGAAAAGADVSEPEQTGAGRRAVPASVAFVPSAAGLILASEVVKDLVGGETAHGRRRQNA